MHTKTTRSGARIVFPTNTEATKAGADHLGDLLAHHASGRRQQAAESFVRLIQSIADDPRIGHDEPTRCEFAQKITAALGVFCDERFTIPESLGIGMLRTNPIIANVFAGVGMTTDVYLRLVAGQKQAAFKSAVLYSPRNTTVIDVGQMLTANPMMASTWLNQAIKTLYQGNADAAVHAHALRILHQLDDRLEPTLDLQETYFLVSYLGNIDTERRVKGLINAAIKRQVTETIRNKPDPRKIAVFSEYWNEGHSVHRTLAGYIRALRPHFDEITLIHAVKKTEELDTTGFDRVIRLKSTGLQLDVEPLQNNPWSAVIFPDVGMTMPSILMSNLRIAPTQILLTGHPVSTFGGEMDWFVSGELTDTNEDNYTERLAILPGFGCVHEPITTEPKPEKQPSDDILIGCAAYGQKINHEWLAAMGQAIRKCQRKIRVRMFTGHAPMSYKGLAVFADTLGEALAPAHVELVAHLSYEQYMAKLAECDFVVDCWPFGGSNTISDALHCRVPVVPVPECHAGRWFSAIGGAMCRAIEASPYIDKYEYVREVARMANDDGYREAVRRHFAGVRLAPIYDHSDAEIFAQFVADVARESGYYAGVKPVYLGGEQ
jgi:hypothetical protein